MLRNIKPAMAFRCRNIYPLIYQRLSIFFCKYHIIMAVLCNGMRGFFPIGRGTFNIELAARQYLYFYKPICHQLLRLHYMLWLHIRKNFHRIAGLA